MSALDDVCKQLALDLVQCKMLAELLPEICPPCAKEMKAGTPRKRSRWQQCIANRRAGQKFDPNAIRALAKEYKEGKCP